MWHTIPKPAIDCTVLLAAVPEKGEEGGMSALDLSPDAVVARTLAKLRAAGLLRPEPVPEPAGPQRGPRRCPQRTPRKRVLKGPRARRPLRSGQHAPRLPRGSEGQF
jgi:hypothetical protein